MQKSIEKVFFLEYSVLGGSPELVAAAWRVWMQWSSSVQAWLRTTLMSENKIAECSQGYNRGWVNLATSASDPAGNEVMGEVKVLPWEFQLSESSFKQVPVGSWQSQPHSLGASKPVLHHNPVKNPVQNSSKRCIKSLTTPKSTDGELL